MERHYIRICNQLDKNLSLQVTSKGRNCVHKKRHVTLKKIKLISFNYDNSTYMLQND